MSSWFKPKAAPPQPVDVSPSLDGPPWFQDILTVLLSLPTQSGHCLSAPRPGETVCAPWP